MCFLKTGKRQSNILLINSIILLALEIFYILYIFIKIENEINIILIPVYSLLILIVILVFINTIFIKIYRTKLKFLTNDKIFFREKFLTEANILLSSVSFLLRIVTFCYDQYRINETNKNIEVIIITIAGIVGFILWLIIIINFLFMRRFAFERVENKDDIPNKNKKKKEYSYI